MKFEVSRVLFNPAADEYLAVAGYAQCHVFTLGPKGEIVDRLCVGPEEWPLDGMHGALLDVDWVPGRTGALSITVSAHVAVFDLAKSSVAPVLTVSLPPREGGGDGAPARIAASAFGPRKGVENRLLVLSEDGALYSHPVRDGDEGDVTIDESCRLALPEVCRGRAGLSVHFSRAHGVALASFDGGATVLARLHPETGAVAASCVVHESDSGSTNRVNGDQNENDEPEASSPFGPAGFSHWSEACAPPPPSLAGAAPAPVEPPPPLFVAASARHDGAAVVVSLGGGAPAAQPLRSNPDAAAQPTGAGQTRGGAASSSATLASVIANQPSVLGHAGYQPIDLDVAFLFALRDDGSLQVFAQEPPPPPGIAAADVQQKQLARAAANASAREAIAARLRGARGVGDDIGNDENDENADESKGAAAAFPLDFFERTTCVTGEVTFGGDLARRTSSDSLRFALQSEDSHVEAPAPGACKVTVSLAKAGHVIVGLRVHLGNSGSTQTPTEMIIGPAPIPAPAPAPPPGVAPPRQPQSSNTTTTTTTTDGRRKFPFEIGARRWYDVPLTRTESVAAERNLVVYLGAAASPGTCVRVDHIEVYSMPKSEFGWEAACDEAAQAAASAALVEAEAAAADGGLDPWEGEATAAGRSDRAARHAARYRGAADEIRQNPSKSNGNASGNARRAPVVRADLLSDEERVLCTSLGLLEKSARRADAAAAAAAARLSLRVLVPATLLEASSDTGVGHAGRTHGSVDDGGRGRGRGGRGAIEGGGGDVDPVDDDPSARVARPPSLRRGGKVPPNEPVLPGEPILLPRRRLLLLR